MKPAFVTLIFVLMSSVLGLLAFAIEVSSDFLAKREMENVKLRCCAVLARTFVVEDNSRPTRYSGWSVDNFEVLQEHLGFKCSSLDTYRTPQSRAYNAYIRMLGNCTKPNGLMKRSKACPCDIGIGAWWQNPQRLEADFLPSQGYDSFHVIAHVNQTYRSSSEAFFLTAFSWSTWGAIAALITCFVALKVLDSVLATFPRPVLDDSWRHRGMARWKRFLLKNWLMFRLRRAVQSTLILTCRQLFMHAPRLKVSKMIGYSTPEWNDSSTRQFTLNFIIALCGLFFILIYEATMTALMVKEDHRSAFHTIDDLKQCRILSKNICYIDGDSTETFWKSIVSERSCKEPKDDSRNMEYEDLMESMKNGSCKYLLADGGLAHSAVNGKNCHQLVRTGEPFFTRSVSFAISPSWKYARLFRIAAAKEQRSNHFKPFDEYIDNMSNNRGCQPFRAPRLTFAQLYVFFVIVAVVCIGIFLEMVCDPQDVGPKFSGHRDDTRDTDVDSVAPSSLRSFPTASVEDSLNSSLD